VIISLKKLRIEGSYVSITKAICEKPIANAILNGKELKVFLLKSGTIECYSISPFLFNVLLELLTRGISNRKKLKGNK
jgi:hypothetical protein